MMCISSRSSTTPSIRLILCWNGKSQWALCVRRTTHQQHANFITNSVRCKCKASFAIIITSSSSAIKRDWATECTNNIVVATKDKCVVVVFSTLLMVWYLHRNVVKNKILCRLSKIMSLKQEQWLSSHLVKTWNGTFVPDTVDSHHIV